MPSRIRFLLSPGGWCLLAFVLRFFYLIEQSHQSVLFSQQTLDEWELTQSAERILNGDGYGNEPLFKAPLYPLFLAVCMKCGGESWFWLARFLQHLGGVALVWLAFDTARRLMPGGEKHRALAGAVAAALITFYPPLIRLENRLVMDFFVTLLQSAMMWALLRELIEPRKFSSGHWLILAGLFAGLSWLTRPTITPVLPLLALLTAYLGPVETHHVRLSRLKRFTAFLLVPLLMMGGVVVRNAVVGGEAMLLPWQGGYNLYHANRPEASGRYYVQDGYASADSGNPTRDLMLQGFHQAVRAGEILSPDEGQVAGAVNDYWMAKAKGVILENPVSWLGKMIQKGIYLTSAREIFNFEAFEIHKSASAILRWIPLGFGILWPFACLSLQISWKGDSSRKKGFWLIWGYLVLMGGAIAMVYTSGRLRMPLVFPVVLLASLSLTLLSEWCRDRSVFTPRAKVFGALLLFAGGVGMSWGDWWGVRSEVVAHYDFARMSDAAWRQNRFEEALGFAEKAEERSPEYLPLPLLKAQALYGLQRVDEAEEEFRNALDLMPQDPTPAYNLGMIQYYERKDPERALPYFRSALQRNPLAQDPWLYMSMCHIRLGEMRQADAYLKEAPGPSSSLRYRIVQVGLYQRLGYREQADRWMEDWFRPLSPALLQQVQEELTLLLTPVVQTPPP